MTHPSKSGVGFPKPIPRKKEKRQREAKNREWVSWVRVKVFEREKNQCRVCQQQAEEMHEMRFRSLGGLVSLKNSIAVCRSCHRDLQQHRIDVVGDDANGILTFDPHVNKTSSQ
tara:strand:- start:19756 stop:20097 length:342 start_codon:yes stop_codon:yes gene_type:complete